MGTFGTAYIICGILYTIACVMDGQDVKPLWKKWVGKKLEKASNYFFPIKYVTETKYKYVPIEPPSPFERCDYDHLTFDAQKIASEAIITESDIMSGYMRQPYRHDVFVEHLIAARKRDCLHAIFNMIAENNLVNFDVDRKSAFPNVIVRAWSYVGKKRNKL